MAPLSPRPEKIDDRFINEQTERMNLAQVVYHESLENLSWAPPEVQDAVVIKTNSWLKGLKKLQDQQRHNSSSSLSLSLDDDEDISFAQAWQDYSARVSFCLRNPADQGYQCLRYTSKHRYGLGIGLAMKMCLLWIVHIAWHSYWQAEPNVLPYAMQIVAQQDSESMHSLSVEHLRKAEARAATQQQQMGTVSYTHLTLPTIA